MFGLGSNLRFYSSRPFHPFASVVEEWIASEVSLYGVRPTTRLGAWRARERVGRCAAGRGLGGSGRGCVNAVRLQADFFVGKENPMTFPRCSRGIHFTRFENLVGM
jgi:hypothetical protein